MLHQKRFVRIAAGLAAAAAVVAHRIARLCRRTAREPARPSVRGPRSAPCAPAFIENRGQADPRIRYYAAGSRYTFQLTRDAALLTFLKDPANGADGGVVLAMGFAGANPSRRARSRDAGARRGQLLSRQRSLGVAHRTVSSRRGGLSRSLASHRPGDARRARRIEIRVQDPCGWPRSPTSASTTPALMASR